MAVELFYMYACGKPAPYLTKNLKMSCLTSLKEPRLPKTLGTCSFQRCGFGIERCKLILSSSS